MEDTINKNVDIKAINEKIENPQKPKTINEMQG